MIILRRNPLTNKLETLLGFAVKSGKIVFGFDNLCETRKKVKLVVEKTKKDAILRILATVGVIIVLGFFVFAWFN